MSGDEQASGVQVLTVEEGSYRACAEALRGVLRAELRGLPVAVVSVAGATRGGKSFLLGFFLRYLRATPPARADGSWLGGMEEPLEGFSWRGGCDRDTVGIQLWSEPFVLTRQNGDKVVVLLMDTQGTFDSSSTTRDSTTIFAMSTLLSSVQIYNLSMNIQEDHLQYLQMFTAYGKLAMEEGGTPFQDLQFLIRDWSYPYQHFYGGIGGQQFLEKRLQVNDNQAEEVKEVRQHIQSCFESVRCFLMPHPGLTVTTSPNFTGCLADISKEFKDALLELVHGVFEENLTLKKVNGQEIQAQELVGYLESYMEVFNSDQMVTPVSILKATSAASLEAALSSARALYSERMESAAQGRSVPRAALPRRHAAAALAARDAFLARRTLAAPERAKEKLNQLMQELDGQLKSYTAENEVKLQVAIASSKMAYEKHMLNICSSECLLDSELEECHWEAVRFALDLFDASRLPLEPGDTDGDDQEDEDRAKLREELENFLSLHEEITQRNKANISAATAAALQKYEEVICPNHPLSSLCVLPDHLRSLHMTAKNAAKVIFELHWKSKGSALDSPVAALLDKIYELLSKFETINTANNSDAVDRAIKFYENNMNYDILNVSCLHPIDFQNEHKELYGSTISAFYYYRTYGTEEAGRDEYKLRLIAELTKCQTRFSEINKDMNKAAVKVAHEFYESAMQIRRGLDAVPQFFGSPDFDVFSRHRLTKELATNRFINILRKDGPMHAEDVYLDELKGLIDSTYKWLILKFIAMGIINFWPLLLLRRFW